MPILESPAALANLLAAWNPPAPVRRAGKPAVRIAPVAKPRRRCDCGACARCLDNAKWERIFNEKFADPCYYGSITLRHNSSLAGI